MLILWHIVKTWRKEISLFPIGFMITKWKAFKYWNYKQWVTRNQKAESDPSILNKISWPEIASHEENCAKLPFCLFFLQWCPFAFLSVVILPSSSPSTSPSQTKTPPFTTSSSTVPSTRVQPTTLSPTECRPNTCQNGGTCIVPGYFCVCPKYYVWNLCAVYVGKCLCGWVDDTVSVVTNTRSSLPGACNFPIFVQRRFHK